MEKGSEMEVPYQLKVTKKTSGAQKCIWHFLYQLELRFRDIRASKKLEYLEE